MAVTNVTQGSVFYFCEFLGPFGWKEHYLLRNDVYVILILSTITNSVIFPFTTIYNLLLIYIIFFKRKVRRKKRNLSIGYLAITDLGVGVILQPTCLAADLCRITGRCKFCVLDFSVWLIANWLCRSSVNHMVIVAWERYVAIKHALQFEVIVTRKRLLFGSITAWVIPLLLDSLLMFVTNPFVPIILFSVYILSCFSILAYFYAVIFMESKRHRLQIKATTPHDQGEGNRTKNQEFRAAKTTFIIISSFAICYLPSIVASVVIYVFLFSTSSFNPIILVVVHWISNLIFFNSLINPIIYGWRSKEIKMMVRNIIGARKKSIETDNAKTKCERLQKTKKTGTKEITPHICWQSVRRLERRLSIPIKLTSTAYVKSNKRRRHTLPGIININNNSDNKYNSYPQNYIDLKRSHKTENERNIITTIAVVHVNSVSKQDEHEL